jgi:hypothetical protein
VGPALGSPYAWPARVGTTVGAAVAGHGGPKGGRAYGPSNGLSWSVFKRPIQPWPCLSQAPILPHSKVIFIGTDHMRRRPRKCVTSSGRRFMNSSGPSRYSPMFPRTFFTGLVAGVGRLTILAARLACGYTLHETSLRLNIGKIF